jgi:hypothetical protein
MADCVTNCAVCLKEITNNNKVITICKHTFHFSCILKNYRLNLSTGNMCPICRASFTVDGMTRLINSVTPSVAPSVASQVASQVAQSVVHSVAPSVIRYNWPPSMLYNWPPSERGDRFNTMIFIRLKDRKYRNITEVERRMYLVNYAYLIIGKFSFHKLKERLGQYGLSRRGYRRCSLEKRLMKHLILDSTGLVV